MFYTEQPCVFKRYPIRTNISPSSKHSPLICVNAECTGHVEERQRSLNVVFNQSSPMPGCWENKQPIWTLHSSTCLWASSARLLNFYQRCAVMSCMHSCRECVLPFLLSHLATIAAAKKKLKFLQVQANYPQAKTTLKLSCSASWEKQELGSFSELPVESDGYLPLPSHSPNTHAITFITWKIPPLPLQNIPCTETHLDHPFKVNSKPFKAVNI